MENIREMCYFCSITRFPMKKILLLLALALGAGPSFGQYDYENRFAMPLDEVLQAMRTEYNKIIVCDTRLSAGKTVPYGLYLFQSDFERTLERVLAPLDLDYTKEGGTYRIKRFEYARRRPQEGIAQLETLAESYSEGLHTWEERRAVLRNCLYATLGVGPLRERLVGEMTVTPKRRMDGYTVENFALELLPGLYATGSIYRPERTRRGERLPFILNPNGHFGTGRYTPEIQMRCAMFARMGAIAVNVDLFAYGESLLAFTAEDHRSSTAMTMQSLQNLALIDYFYAQPDVDPARIAVTGASGGGSQTMMLAAIDERVAVSAPVIMVSSYFMGGCGCESGLPVAWCGREFGPTGTNLAEIAALTAPRPQLIVSDGGDWTNLVDQYEYPFIRHIYGFYGAEDRVTNVHLPTEGHDWSPAKRHAVYAFMAEQLGLDAAAGQSAPGVWDEQTLTIEDAGAMKAFGPAGERFPAGALRGIDNLRRMIADIRRGAE